MEKNKIGFLSKFTLPQKYAFISCFISGLLVHLFAFTNIIPNSDGLSRVFDTQQMTVSGRWFLYYASSVNGYVQSPALIGVLSVLFLSVSAMLIADILDIKDKLFASLCGIFTVVFPSVAFTYLYMFTASAYSLGILFAVFSVWLSVKFRFGFIPGAFALALATGTYQAYFSVGSALAICYVIKSIFNTDSKVKDIIKKALILVGELALGAGLYYIILKIFLAVKNLELLSYLGMDSVSLSLKSLISGTVTAYKQFLLYFFRPGTESYVTKTVVAFNILMATALVCAIIALIKKGLGKGTVSKTVLLAVLFILFPLGCNATAVISVSTPIMRYSLVFVYILVIALCSVAFDGFELKLASPKSLVLIILSFVVLLSAQTANTAYTAMATSHRATQTFATNLVSRVESLDGYEKDMEVVIIGIFPSDSYYNDNEAFQSVSHYSCDPNSVILRNKHIYYYLNEWLNVQWKQPSEETMISVSDSDEFKEMPLYPDDGSVKIIDGKVVVRLSEEYTPLEQYEIDYENRR